MLPKQVLTYYRQRKSVPSYQKQLFYSNNSEDAFLKILRKAYHTDVVANKNEVEFILTADGVMIQSSPATSVQ